MADTGISAPAEGTLLISDKYLDAKQGDPGVVIDCVEMTPAAAFETKVVAPTGTDGRFEPRGVSVNGVLVEGVVDEDASFAFLKRRLKNDPEAARLKYATGVIHSDRVRYIYPRGTTARGIAIRA